MAFFEYSYLPAIMIVTDSICVSLEMAKKLAKAGWPQLDSLFIVMDDGEIRYRAIQLTDESGNMTGTCFAAPTAEEILRNMPEIIKQQDGLKEFIYFQNVYRSRGNFCVAYYTLRDMEQVVDLEDESLANAAASCWCYLKENNLL